MRSAQGYYELGMLAEAREELESIGAEHDDDPSVLQIRLLLLLKEKRWEEGLGVSRKLCEAEVGSSMGFIHAAYCLHEMGNTAEAKNLLLSGPSSLLREPVYFYNMGCYEVALGEMDKARRSLRQSFEMDRTLLDVAKKDPDLESLWNAL